MNFRPRLYLFTLALFAIIHISLADYKIPQEVIDAMATREMRYVHFLWHNVRNLWNALDEGTQAQIRDLGWEPPRPALQYDIFGSSNIQDNDSGEDFFYMHRHMISQVNKIMKRVSPGTKLEGFDSIPPPDDQDFSVLPVYTVPGDENKDLNDAIAYYKSDDFYWDQIKPAEDKFIDPEYLKSVSLGQLGSQIEFEIHGWLHMRFSTEASEIRPDSEDPVPYVDEKWDDPSYNWLGDTYSSHVHPLFWKIHGWVDDRIKDWQKANNVKIIKWKGTWVGGSTSSIHDIMNGNHNNHDNMERNLKQVSDTEAMEKVMQLLLKSGKCTYFYCQNFRSS